MEIPQGWENHYPKDAVLKLLETLYGLKQAVLAFSREILKCMESMQMNCSAEDPCLYYQCNTLGLVIIVSWINDNLST